MVTIATKTDWQQGQVALRDAVLQVTSLLRSVGDSGAPAVGQWSLGEVAMHLSQAWIAVPDLARQDQSRVHKAMPSLAGAAGDSLIRDIWDLSETTILGVRSDPERDPRVLADRIEARARVLAGTTDELSRDRPLGALIEAFELEADSPDPERAEIGQLITGELPVSQSPPFHSGIADLSFRIIDASVALLERLATEGPIMVTFEHLHWADPATLRAVRAIGRALFQLPVLLLVTLRPFPERPELARLIEDLLGHGAAHLSLAALDDPAVTALATAVAGAPPGTALSDQLSWAGGNPLFVIELLKALGDQEILTVQHGRAEVAELVVPSSLPMTIRRRMSFLPAATLELLKVATVLGREFSMTELAAVTGRSAVTLLPELDAALRAGLLGHTPAEGSRFDTN